MLFKQFYLEALGHASYLIGSEQTGEAFVLDVRRDVSQYFDFARDNDLTIRFAADTHQHNDYLTGVTELQQRSPLELLASARAELGYAARKLEGGARLQMGEIEFEVLDTPGHTPEHVSFLVRDLARGEEPAFLGGRIAGGRRGQAGPARRRIGCPRGRRRTWPDVATEDPDAARPRARLPHACGGLPLRWEHRLDVGDHNRLRKAA